MKIGNLNPRSNSDDVSKKQNRSAKKIQLGEGAKLVLRDAEKDSGLHGQLALAWLKGQRDALLTAFERMGVRSP